jgi:uncharacterized protein (TIGR00369 family)
MIKDIVLPFLDYVGAELKEYQKGSATVGLNVKNHHVQHLGIVHGGVISTLLDNTGWYAAMTELTANQTAVTSEIKINYLRPAQGKCLQCIADVIKSGKTSIFVKIELIDKENENKLLAYATATYAILKK